MVMSKRGYNRKRLDRGVLEEPGAAGVGEAPVAPGADDDRRRGERPLSTLELLDEALEHLREAREKLAFQEEEEIPF